MRRDAGAFSAMRNYLKGDLHLIQKKVREINKGLHDNLMRREQFLDLFDDHCV